MQGSKIYSDFSPEIAWIRREVASDVQKFSPSIRPLARYYTEGRLKILGGGGVSTVADQRTGTPVPYAAFWFADALGLNDDRLRRLSGLSLLYSSIAATLGDDTADSGPADSSGRARLTRYWSRRYAQTLGDVFPGEQEFRRAMSSADEEWRRFREWQSIPLAGAHRRPFSAGFLGESSRYYVACTLPPLVAIAHASGRKEEAPRIEMFLREFSMGWRIVDDLMDWEADLVAREMNRSSVLTYVRARMGQKKLVDRIDALSWFLTDEFVRDAYGAMVGFFLKARRAVAGYGNPYLDCFMRELIEFQTDKRDSLLRHATLTLSDLNEGLTTVLGPRTRPGPRKRESLLRRR